MCDAPLLLVSGCDYCGRPFRLLASTVIGMICPTCYRERHYPLGANLAKPEVLEIQTRERMLARGSADRHMVRSGRT